MPVVATDAEREEVEVVVDVGADLWARIACDAQRRHTASRDVDPERAFTDAITANIEPVVQVAVDDEIKQASDVPGLDMEVTADA